jgi:DNA repair protein RecO (recombination protein O)
MEIRYNAIILKKKEVGETDRLYTLYTSKHGKVQTVAKGVRKSEAKLAGQLETLMHGLVIIVKGRGMGKIAGAVAENAFPHLRTDVDILRRVLDTANAFERLVEWDESDPELFQLLFEYLVLANALSKEKKREKVELLSQGFLFQLYAHLGYRIETGTCAVSGEKLRAGKQHFFSPSQGGVLSGEHHHGAEHAFPISETTIKYIRLFLSNRLESLEKVQATDRELKELRLVSSRFFLWIEH